MTTVATVGVDDSELVDTEVVEENVAFVGANVAIVGRNVDVVATVAVFENTNGVNEAVFRLYGVDAELSALEVVLSCTGPLVRLGVVEDAAADVKLLEAAAVGVDVDVNSTVDVYSQVDADEDPDDDVNSSVDVYAHVDVDADSDSDADSDADVDSAVDVDADVDVGSAMTILELADSPSSRIC